MVSARRVKRRAKKEKKALLPFFKLVVVFCIVLFSFLFIKLNTKYWDGKEKIAYALSGGGDIDVILIDPDLGEETTFKIPGDTEVSVSQNLGTLRIKNVAQLGQNEKKGGELLPATITKNFYFPIFLWSDKNPSDPAFITTKNSNIPLGDRIYLFLFEKKVKDIDRNEIDLAKSQFLIKGKLSDGEPGYKIPGQISERLTFYFTDQKMSEKGVRVYIKDQSGAYGVSERLGTIVEVVGTKVVSIEKSPQVEDFFCKVSGKDKDASAKISRLFGCKLTSSDTDYDVEISIGSGFSL